MKRLTADPKINIGISSQRPKPPIHQTCQSSHMLRGARRWCCKWVSRHSASLKKLTLSLGNTRMKWLSLIRNCNSWCLGSWILQNVRHVIGHWKSKSGAPVKSMAPRVLGLLLAMYILSTFVYYMRAYTDLQNLRPHHLRVDGSCSLSGTKGTLRQTRDRRLMRAAHQHHLHRQMVSQQKLSAPDTLKDAMS